MTKTRVSLKNKVRVVSCHGNAIPADCRGVVVQVLVQRGGGFLI